MRIPTPSKVWRACLVRRGPIASLKMRLRKSFGKERTFTKPWPRHRGRLRHTLIASGGVRTQRLRRKLASRKLEGSELQPAVWPARSYSWLKGLQEAKPRCAVGDDMRWLL